MTSLDTIHTSHDRLQDEMLSLGVQGAIIDMIMMTGIAHAQTNITEFADVIDCEEKVKNRRLPKGASDKSTGFVQQTCTAMEEFSQCLTNEKCRNDTINKCLSLCARLQNS